MKSTISIACLLVVLSLCAPCAAFIRGDANGDGLVNVADAITTLSYLFVPGTPTPACLDAVDVDDDGQLLIGDAVVLLSSLFVPGSPPPAPPYPNDGFDPTPDALGDCGGGGGPLPFETLVEGVFCGATPIVTIIRDAAAWDSFWLEFGSIFFPPPAQPSVDFSIDMVVVIVNAGNTSGYTMHIDDLIATPAGIEVHYTFGVPLGFCITLDVLTQPHHIVRAPATPGAAIQFETVVDTCP
ncbi:MAG: hypothetical protein ACKVX7_15225 [Planctomycetota bacterium]